VAVAATTAHARIPRRAAPLFPGRQQLPILGHGNERFVQNVARVLGEARRYHPTAYEDALQYLPKAEWVPDHPRFRGNTYVAFSDGIFRTDGTTAQGYAEFRRVVWHEVGHQTDADISGSPAGEARADAYAEAVIAQIEQAKQQQSRPVTMVVPECTPAPLPPMTHINMGQRIFANMQTTDPSIWRRVGAGRV
jgi:hypothetical protein